jgi:hypothetical protein
MRACSTLAAAHAASGEPGRADELAAQAAALASRAGDAERSARSPRDAMRTGKGTPGSRRARSSCIRHSRTREMRRSAG